MRTIVTDGSRTFLDGHDEPFFAPALGDRVVLPAKPPSGEKQFIVMSRAWQIEEGRETILTVTVKPA